MCSHPPPFIMCCLLQQYTIRARTRSRTRESTRIQCVRLYCTCKRKTHLAAAQPPEWNVCRLWWRSFHIVPHCAECYSAQINGAKFSLKCDDTKRHNHPADVIAANASLPDWNRSNSVLSAVLVCDVVRTSACDPIELAS